MWSQFFDCSSDGAARAFDFSAAQLAQNTSVAVGFDCLASWLSDCPSDLATLKSLDLILGRRLDFWHSRQSHLPRRSDSERLLSASASLIVIVLGVSLARNQPLVVIVAAV